MNEASAGAVDASVGETTISTVPRQVWGFLARIPFTITVVALMLVAGALTRSLWDPLVDRDLFGQVAYGLPALRDGRWWTVVSGSFFALTPLQYLPVAAGFGLLVGWSEWHLGTARTAIATVVGQITGVLGSALVLAALSATSWGWAVRVADDLDVGFSAGALAACAAATVVIRPPWRARLRFGLSLYAVITFLYIGVLWDLEHLVGVLVGLALGPFLLGRRPQLRAPRLSRHEWRVVAATLFLVAALIRLVLWFAPADGPLGASSGDTTVTGVLLSAAVSLLLANSLRKGRRRAWLWALALNSIALPLVAVVVVVALLAPDPVIVSGDNPGATIPAFVVDLLLWVLQMTVLIAGRRAFQGPSARRLRQGSGTVDAHDQAVDLLTSCGGTTLSWMGTWPANSWFVVEDAHQQPIGYVAFQPHRGVGVALGDPVGPDLAARHRLLDAFVDQQQELARRFCLFSVTQEVLDWAETRGFRHVQVAQEAVIDLPGLEFRGKSWQDVRTALNRAAKEGITYQEGRLADMPRTVIAQVRAISEMWVSDKGLPEMGFTLGGVDEALDRATMVGLAIDADGRVHGVTSWLPVHSPGGAIRGWTLDVMRRLPDGFRPVTEFLIASACLSFRDSGAELVSLSGAPLAHSGDPAHRDALALLLDRIGESLEPLYGFRSPESFKAKFKPRDVPLFMVFRDEAALPRIGLALTEAYLPDAPLHQVAFSGLRAGIDASTQR